MPSIKLRMLPKMYLFVIMLMLRLPKVWSQKMSDAVRQDLITPMRELGEACGYESCQLVKEGAINVHIIPHSHGELATIRTFHEHYSGMREGDNLKSIVNWKRIIEAVVNELWQWERRTFTLSDTPYFLHWWAMADGSVQRMVYQLIRQGRLHIVGGGWGMPDESCTSYHALIDQFTHSLRKLNQTFGYCGRPLVAWQADTYGHSREFANLASMLAFDGLFINPISYEDEINRMPKRELEMLWRGSDDLGPESDIFTHKLFDGYWPPPGFCFGTGCNDSLIITSDSQFKNVQERVSEFIDSVKNRQSHSYATNHIVVVMGMRMAYYDAPMWYNNIDSLIRYTNLKSGPAGDNVYLMYSSPACYLKAVQEARPKLPTKQDDFMPLTFDKTTHFTGLFTSRPTIKFMAREGHVFLQMAKQMHVLAQLPAKESKLYDELTWVMGVFQDHNIITGAMFPHVKDYYTAKMYNAVQRSTLLLKKAFNKLRNCKAQITYFRCSFNMSSCVNTNSLRSFIVVYNALAWPVTVPIRIPVVRHERHTVFDHRLHTVKAVSMKMSDEVLRIPGRKTVANHEIVFIAEHLPPMGYRSYYIESDTVAQLRKKRSIIKKLGKTMKKKYLSRQTDQMKIDDESMLSDEEDEDSTEEPTTPFFEYANDTFDDFRRPLYDSQESGGRYVGVISDEEENKYKALFGRAKPSSPKEEDEWITDKPRRIIEEDVRKPNAWRNIWGVSKHKAPARTENFLKRKYNKPRPQPMDNYKLKKPQRNFFFTKKYLQPTELENEHKESFPRFGLVPRPKIKLYSTTPKVFTNRPPNDSTATTDDENYFKSNYTQKDEFISLNTEKDGFLTLSTETEDYTTFNTRTEDYKSLNIQTESYKSLNSEKEDSKAHDAKDMNTHQHFTDDINLMKTKMDRVKPEGIPSAKDPGLIVSNNGEESENAASESNKEEFIFSDTSDNDTYSQSGSDTEDIPFRLKQQETIALKPRGNYRRLYEGPHLTSTPRSNVSTTTEYDLWDDPDFDEDKYYFYRVSTDKFIKNKHIKVHLGDNNRVVRVTLSNGVEVALTISLHYYVSDEPVKMGRCEDKRPNMYIFKVMDPEPVLVEDYVKSVVHKTYIVEEVQYSLSSWAGFVVRVYVDRPLVELDWVVGPVPIEDGLGKDVFIRYSTDLASGGVFYTDSNGRQTVKRVRDRRPTYQPVTTDIPSNIYPITSKIHIEDPQKNIRFSIFNDRAQGGTSLHDGQIDLMLHRRILTEDGRPPANLERQAPLNETEFGQGIIVRGKHIIYISKADYKPNKIFEKKLAKEIEMAPKVLASPLKAYGVNTKEIWYREKNEYKGVVKKIPAGIHVLTLEQWSANTLLLRLENYLEKADTVKSGFKTVFIKDLFANITIIGINETTLGANVWLKDWMPLQWNTKEKFVKNFNEFYNGNGTLEYSDQDVREYEEPDIAKGITLVPQQIRTFIVTYEYRN